jgi:hypothetical protein
MRASVAIRATVLVLTLALSACATATLQLTGAGKVVRVITADPPARCEEIGGVTGFSNAFTENPVENAKTQLRNQAAEQGATVVRLETMTKNPRYGSVTVTGTAYNCDE